MTEFRVLIIDDEEELVTTLVERLSYRDIDAEYSLDGYDALSKMRESKFDVVVLDLKLPGMDGLEVLRRINDSYPQVPVLLITGHGSVENGSEPAPEGVFDYLMKPVDLDDLIAKLREALRGKQA
jgi:DNA-binding NtrC family response regulator